MSAETTPRFFIDHDMIHDRITGRHVHGNRDIEPSIADDSITMLNDLHYSALREIKRATAQPPARMEGMPKYPEDAMIVAHRYLSNVTDVGLTDSQLSEIVRYANLLSARCVELQAVDAVAEDYRERLEHETIERRKVEARCEELAGEVRIQVDEVTELRAQLAAEHQHITSLCEVFDCKPSDLLTRTKELAAQSRWVPVGERLPQVNMTTEEITRIRNLGCGND